MSSKSKPEIQKYKKLIEDAQSTDGDADVRTQMEVKDYEEAFELAKLKSFQDDIKARKLYAGLIYTLVVLWLGFILWIVIATGSGWYKLSDTVLVALITTTTLNVLGLFLVVTQYLFPKK